MCADLFMLDDYISGHKVKMLNMYAFLTYDTYIIIPYTAEYCYVRGMLLKLIGGEINVFLNYLLIKIKNEITKIKFL